jgi:hypothetical protein
VWDAEEALRSLADESRLIDGDDPAATAKRVFRENAGVAAAAIVHIAKYSPSDRTRLEAARYVVERNLGKIGEESVAEEDPLTRLLGAVVKDEEDAIERARVTLNGTLEPGDDTDEED